MQIIMRMRLEDLYDLALEVVAVWPGVGANDGVAGFLRCREGMAWDYEHPLKSARTGTIYGGDHVPGPCGAAGHGRGRLHSRHGRREWR